MEGPIILQLDVKDYFPGTWEKMTPKEREEWRRRFAVYQNKFRRRLERWTRGKQQEKQVNDLVAALCGFAEMTHVYYEAMLGAGATNREATSAMNAFVAAFWNEQMEDARRKNGGQQGNE